MTIECPILRQIFRSIKSIASVDALSADLVDLDDLQLEIQSVPSGVNYSRLRGFTAIEEMLSHLEDVYIYRYKTNLSPDIDLKIKTRSWAGLTAVLDDLGKLSDDIELEFAEARLEGHLVSTDKDYILVGDSAPDAAENSARRAQRLLAARTIHRILPRLVGSIHSLRPFLANADAPLSNIGDGVVEVMQEIYGVSLMEPLIAITRRLIGVKL